MKKNFSGVLFENHTPCLPIFPFCAFFHVPAPCWAQESVEAAQKGETVYLAVPEQVRRRDKVYLLRPRMLEDA